MGEKNTCDICNSPNEQVELISSGIAPVTYGLCAECKKRGAENIGVVSFWIASNGGPDTAPDFCLRLVSYFDGDYKDWQDIGDYFANNEAQILASFREEFELVDDPIEGAE